MARSVAFQTSARVAFACASVGLATEAHVAKELMPEAKTTLCFSATQPETMTFWPASDAFEKVMTVPENFDVTSDSARSLKTSVMVLDVAATVSRP